jgi:hypothetical protein
MKKLITTLAISGLSVAAFAQGIVTWNSVAGFLQVQTNDTVWSTFEPSAGQAAPTGTIGVTTGNANNASLGYGGAGYYYELLASANGTTAPTTVAGLSGWLDTGLSGANATGTGKMLQNNPSTGATANNWAAGAASGIVLVGWSANLGGSWAVASSNLVNWATAGVNNTGANVAYFGVSSVGNIVSGTAPPGPQLFGTGAGQIASGAANPMQLDALATTVPEPGTLALAAIGGASLLLFRRKK